MTKSAEIQNNWNLPQWKHHRQSLGCLTWLISSCSPQVTTIYTICMYLKKYTGIPHTLYTHVLIPLGAEVEKHTHGQCWVGLKWLPLKRNFNKPLPIEVHLRKQNWLQGWHLSLSSLDIFIGFKFIAFATCFPIQTRCQTHYKQIRTIKHVCNIRACPLGSSS